MVTEERLMLVAEMENVSQIIYLHLHAHSYIHSLMHAHTHSYIHTYTQTILFNIDADGDRVSDKSLYTRFEQLLKDDSLEYVNSKML